MTNGDALIGRRATVGGFVGSAVSSACGDGAGPTPLRGDAGGLIDMSDVDRSTVDRTTIDWDNIDITQLRTDRVEQNPTVGDLSPDDLAIVQRRLTGSFGSGEVAVTIDGRTPFLKYPSRSTPVVDSAASARRGVSGGAR